MLEIEVTVSDKKHVLQFEHSLLSLSKWESIHRKAFMGSSMKTPVEMMDYYIAMLLPGQDADLVYAVEDFTKLNDYINTSQTASSVPKQGGVNNETTTSELIYYWMAELGIDWRAESWHLTRLLVLIEITNFKKQPPKKRATHEVMTDWAKINERQQQLIKANKEES